MLILKNFAELNEQEKQKVIQNIKNTDFIENLATELVDNYQYEDAIDNFKYEYENCSLSEIVSYKDIMNNLKNNYWSNYVDNWFIFDLHDLKVIYKDLKDKTKNFLDDLEYNFYIHFNPNKSDQIDYDTSLDDMGNIPIQIKNNILTINECLNDIGNVLTEHFDKIISLIPNYDDLIDGNINYFRNDDSALIEELEVRDPLIDNDYNIVNLSYNN